MQKPIKPSEQLNQILDNMFEKIWVARHNDMMEPLYDFLQDLCEPISIHIAEDLKQDNL